LLSITIVVFQNQILPFIKDVDGRRVTTNDL